VRKLRTCRFGFPTHVGNDRTHVASLRTRVGNEEHLVRELPRNVRKHEQHVQMNEQRARTNEQRVRGAEPRVTSVVASVRKEKLRAGSLLQQRSPPLVDIRPHDERFLSPRPRKTRCVMVLSM